MEHSFFYKKKIILLSLFICFVILTLFSLNFISAPDSHNLGVALVKSTGQSWVIAKQTGNEKNFKVIFADVKIKKTDICFVLKDGVNPASVGLTAKYLYNQDGNSILDDKSKAISLKYETAKCLDNGVIKDGYHILLTDAQAVNIDNYIQLGNSTLILVYEDLNLINYNFDNGSTNITLYKNNNSVNDIYVYFDVLKYKFGANDSFNTNLENYSYIINSNNKLYKKERVYTQIVYFNDSYSSCVDENCTITENITFTNSYENYIKYPVFNNIIDYNTYQEVQEYDFKDICIKSYSNCNWSCYDNYTCIVNFVSDKFIDPDIENKSIIKITDAEHLDSNKSLIANIYTYVSEKDDLWYNIPVNNYLRTYWETNLTNLRKIDIYAKSNGTGILEVYKKDNNSLITSLNITEDKKYIVDLSNMTGISDAFDFKILNSSIDFDYIIDPDGWCYQESSNSTVGCSGTCTCFNTGTYISSGSWTSLLNTYDTNWSSYGFQASGTAYLYINYTKPTNSVSTSLWQLRWATGGGLFQNFSINSSCWNYDNSKLALRVGVSSSGVPALCLNGNTKILTTSGNKKIKELRKGDMIYSYNEELNKIEEDYVLDIVNGSIKDVGNKYYYIYYSYFLIFEKFIKSTFNHKFYVNGEYISAEDLKIGDVLIDKNLKKHKIKRIEIVNNTKDIVWDIRVKNNNNFFAENILVHNAFPGIAYDCFNGTGWVRVYGFTSGGASNFYEEGMAWNISTSVSDTIYPTFSSFWANNGSIVTNGIGLFNATVIDTNGTVFLLINNTNYTAENVTANVYNVSLNFTTNGTYTYYWISFGNGTSKNYNISNVLHYNVNFTDLIFPVINVRYPSNNTNYTYNVTDFNYTYIDMYPDSCWYSKNYGITNTTRVIAKTNFTNILSNEGYNNYTLYCNDTYNNLNQTTVSFIKDTVFPVFSSYWDNNATILANDTGFFNVTLVNTNGTVILEINNTNVSATNLTATTFNVSYYFNNSGVYTYRWHSWGNGTIRNYNKTSDRYYTVNTTGGITNNLVNITNFITLNGINQRLGYLTRNALNSISVNNFISRISKGIKNLYNSIAINTLIIRTTSIKKNVIDSFSINMLVNRLHSAIVSINQNISINLYVSRISTNLFNIYQSISINMLTDRLTTSFRNIYDNLIFDMHIDRYFSNVKNVYQVININLIVNKLNSFYASVLNSININNLVNKLGSFSRNIYQETAINTLVSRLTVSIRNVYQEIIISLISPRLLTLTENVYQNVNINILADKFANFGRSIFDSITINNFSNVIKGITINLYQSVSIDSLTSRLNSFVRNINQIIDFFLTLVGLEAPSIPSGGGGGGTILFKANETICNITYQEIIKGNKNITSILEKIKIITHKSESYTVIEYYVNNWQVLCSDKINKTLNPGLVCNKIYYFIINNDYNFTEKDFYDLKKSINISISNSLLYHYMENYNEFCYNLKYSDKLPYKKLPLLVIREDIFNEMGKGWFNFTDCSPEMNTFLDLYVPTFYNFYFGDISCEDINFWRWFVKIRNIESNYYVIGIKLWVIVAIVLIIILIYLIKVKNLLKKIKGYYKKV